MSPEEATATGTLGCRPGHDGDASLMGWGWCGRARKSWMAGARPGHDEDPGRHYSPRSP